MRLINLGPALQAPEASGDEFQLAAVIAFLPLPVYGVFLLHAGGPSESVARADQGYMPAMERSAATAGIIVGLLVVVLSIILDWGWAATVIGLTIFVVLGLVAMALGRRGAAAR